MQMKLGLDARNRVRTARRDNGMMPGASLRLRRSWYAEGDPNPDPASSGTGTGDIGSGANGSGAATVDALPKWAQDLIKELRTEAGDNRMKAKQIADEKAAAEAAVLAEQGKFKELYEKTKAELDAQKAVQDRAAALEGLIQATNDVRIKRIPESMRSVVPTDYTPEMLTKWLDANEHVLTKAPAPNLDGGAGGSGAGSPPQPKATPEQSALASIAQNLGYNVKPEAVAARAKELEAQRQRKPAPDKE